MHTPLSQRDIYVQYAFKDAYSPHLAAKKNNVIISLEPILTTYHHICQHYDFVLVEGCGGLICPLSRDLWQIDIIQAFQMPIYLITTSGLGTLHSALSTFAYAKNNDISIESIIMNRYNPNNIIHQDNKNVLLQETNCSIQAVS